MDHNLHEIDVQPTDRVAFIHIPKTAGLTFSALLDPLLSGLPRYPEIIALKLVQMEYAEIEKYRLFMGHFSLGLLKKIFPTNFLTLIFLREPVSRTISHFKYLQRQETLGGQLIVDHQLRRIKDMTFDEFILNSELNLSSDIVNLQTRLLGTLGTNLLAKQVKNDVQKDLIPNKLNEISDSADVEISVSNDIWFAGQKNLEIAKENLSSSAFFGVTERFQDSLFLLSFIFGWPPMIDALHLNRAPGSDSDNVKHLDPRTLALINERIDLDKELYAFGQKLFEEKFNIMTHLLLERYGSAIHKSLALPLPTNVMTELLQKHYEVRREHRNQSLLQEIGSEYFYSPSSYSEGAFGWYPLEISDLHGPMRWSGPGLEFGVDLPQPAGRRIQISFRILMALQQDIIDQLSLQVNKVAVPLRYSVDEYGAFIFLGEIPHQASIGSFLHLVFSVPQTIAPSTVDPNNEDSRPLGVLLNWVKLQSH